MIIYYCNLCQTNDPIDVDFYSHKQPHKIYITLEEPNNIFKYELDVCKECYCRYHAEIKAKTRPLSSGGKSMRNPIQISTSAFEANDGKLFYEAIAICDDNTIWQTDLTKGPPVWQQLPAIPQDERINKLPVNKLPDDFKPCCEGMMACNQHLPDNNRFEVFTE